MTAKQLVFYHCLARDCRRAMQGFGRAVTEEDWKAELAAIKLQAIGADKSSRDFTNREFDMMKAALLAWARPGDLRAQLAAQAQPFIRWRFRVDDLLDRIAAILAARAFHAEALPLARGPAREGYLLALARRLGGRGEDFLSLDGLTEEERWKVMSALAVRFDQVARKRGCGHGRESPTRRNQPPRQRPFDEPVQTELAPTGGEEPF